MQDSVSKNTLYVEQATVLSQDAYSKGQYHMRLYSPKIAAKAKPGCFIHIKCDPSLPMRRPLSIMRNSSKTGVVDILYKIKGQGTVLLSEKKRGNTLDLLGPIGKSFKLDNYKKRPLLIGGGVGIPPIIFLAEHIKNVKGVEPFVIMGSEIPFPFQLTPSKITLEEQLSPSVNACMPLLDNMGIPSRLASLQDYSGCFKGYVTDLAQKWLDHLDNEQRETVEIFSCGPMSMLKAINQLANKYGLSCQVSLEEYMACATGGCAGCAVLIKINNKQTMKRVCVDGPIFEANSVVQLQQS